MTTDAPTASRKRKTTVLLSILALGMFGFGFALVPLYDLFCQVTGVQSVSLRSERGPDNPVADGSGPGRIVKVKFDTSVHPSLPWDFSAKDVSLEVRTGEIYEVDFLAHNRSSAQIAGQAIPSVVPWQATAYFSKLECFCFNRQVLSGGETTNMPLRFMVSPELPADINSLTLSYSFMKLDAGRQQEAETEKVQTSHKTSITQGYLYVSQY